MKFINTRKFIWILCGIGCLLALVSIFFLPDVIPVHFSNGYPDDLRGNDETPEDKYYLLIGTEGVHDIEVSTPKLSGGCRNADNSSFKKGEKVWIEQLNSDSDLRDVTITAHDTEGNAIYTFSVPEKATDDEITRLVNGDSWLMPPITADIQ